MAMLGKSGSLRRALGGVLLGAALAGTAAAPARAEDPGVTMRDLAEASDFRVRVSAALVLGHTHPDGAREALEEALGDAHPAVRVAAARALGTLGDTDALPAMQRRLAQDSSASVKARLRASIGQLRSAAGTEEAQSGRLPANVRYLVELGTMRSHCGVAPARGEELEAVLGGAAEARAKTMRGTVLVEDGDDGLRRQAAARHVPVITLDGNIIQMTESRVGGGTQVQVRVEFAVRRGQTLKGTVSGAATTFGSGGDLTEQSRRKLQEDAVQAAVQSALRGAEDGLLVAAR
jgi:hypothetical protein